jgi:hypothetical protein
MAMDFYRLPYAKNFLNWVTDPKKKLSMEY